MADCCKDTELTHATGGVLSGPIEIGNSSCVIEAADETACCGGSGSTCPCSSAE